MALFEKYMAYRWVTAGRGDGGDGGGNPLVLILIIIMGFIGVLWLLSTLLSFLWGLIYGFVRPILMVFPPVTIPLAVVLIGWPFTWLAPYSSEKTAAFLDDGGDTIPFAVSSIWAVASINALFLLGHYEAFPEPNGISGIILTLAVLCFTMYGLYELFHLPYRSFKLLLHAPRGSVYVIALLSPMATVFVTSAFNVSLNISLPLPSLPGSEFAVTVASLVFLNILYAGGAMTVLRNRDEILSQANAPEQDGPHLEENTGTAAPTGSS